MGGRGLAHKHVAHTKTGIPPPFSGLPGCVPGGGGGGGGVFGGGGSPPPPPPPPPAPPPQSLIWEGRDPHLYMSLTPRVGSPAWLCIQVDRG
jgi:hypothetical protein